MRKLMVLAVIISIFAVFACNQGKKGGNSVDLFPKDNGTVVVAEFDGIKITDVYIKSYLDQLNPYLKSRYNTPEKKEELITKILESEILTREAVKKGVVNDPVLLSKLKSTISRHYAGAGLKTEIEEKLKVTDEDMKKYFEEHKSQYNSPEKVKASHILIKVDAAAKKEDKDKAMKLAKQVLAEAKKKANDPNVFNELVKKYSQDDGSKSRGGDVGFFEKTEEGGRMAKEFADAAFALKEINDISDVVTTTFGYHIIKLTGKREKVEKTFEDVKSRIDSTLKSDKRQSAYNETVEGIKKSMNFTINKDAVAKLDFGVSDKVQEASKDFDKNQADGQKGGMPNNPAKLQEAIKNMQRQAATQPIQQPTQPGQPIQPVKLPVQPEKPAEKK